MACRLVSWVTDPFSRTVHDLAPDLSVDGAGEYKPITPPAAGPLIRTGDVGRTTVSAGRATGRKGLAGVAVALLRADVGEGGYAGAYRPTGETALTSADGRWSLTIADRSPSAVYRVVATALGAASGRLEVAPSPRRTGARVAINKSPASRPIRAPYRV